MLNIRSKFKKTIDLINAEGSVLYFYPKTKTFKIVKSDKKVLYKTLKEMEDHEDSLNNKKTGIKRIKKILSNSIKIQ